MKRYFLPSLVALLAGPAAWAGDPPRPVKAVPLKVDGDAVLVIRSLPFTVTAPAGADDYVWSYPAGVTAVERDNVLEVTAEPAGRHRVTVVTRTITVDFEAKKLVKTKDTGETVVQVGVPQPPAPADPLAEPVQAAYGADASPTKAADKAALAAVYRAAAVAAKAEAVKTAADLTAVISSAVAARVGDRLKPVRQMFGGEFGKYLPADPAAGLGDAQKAAAAAQLTRYAGILEATK